MIMMIIMMMRMMMMMMMMMNDDNDDDDDDMSTHTHTRHGLAMPSLPFDKAFKGERS